MEHHRPRILTEDASDSIRRARAHTEDTESSSAGVEDRHVSENGQDHHGGGAGRRNSRKSLSSCMTSDTQATSHRARSKGRGSDNSEFHSSESDSLERKPKAEEEEVLEEDEVLEQNMLGADDNFGAVTELSAPPWLLCCMDATGISTFLWKIEDERALRADEDFQNPYPGIHALVTSMKFEALIASVILLNCLVIGWQFSVSEGQEIFAILEHFFTAFFFIEWCLRMTAFGWSWCFEPANFADTILVFGTGVFVKWVLEPSGTSAGGLRMFTVLRTLRLVRLARAVRLNPMFHEAWMLIHGLVTSARPLLWTMVIFSSVLYIFSVAGTEIIGKRSHFQNNDYAQELFGNLPRSMFTFFQLLTMDTYFNEVIRPMMENLNGTRDETRLGLTARMGDEDPGLALFFIFFITVAVFVVSNLITAIIVENAFAIAQEDQDSLAKAIETQKKEDLKELAKLFLQLDEDGSGELSKQEFTEALRSKEVQELLVLLEMKVTEFMEAWEILDDGDGSLTIKEFTNGMRRMRGPAKAKDILEIDKRLMRIDQRHKDLKVEVQKFTGTVKDIEKDAKRIATDMREALSLFHEIYHRFGAAIQKQEYSDALKKRDRQARRLKEQQEVESEGSDMESDEEEDDDEMDQSPQSRGQL
mmetsp:Transcript_54084/g.128811  ORF Transcript_54084/g.128811 Transcript_54084/m.128811 type:complete len:645 (-) Transcript_54084:135-2069(-)